MADESFARLVAELMEKESIADAGGEQDRRLGAYMRDASRALPQSGAASPHLADRHGRFAKAAAAVARAQARARLARGAPIERLALGVAAWMRYVTGVDERGRPIDVRDPLSARLQGDRRPGRSRGGPPRPGAHGRARNLWRRLPADPRFAMPVTAALDSLIRLGSRGAVAHCLHLAHGD